MDYPILIYPAEEGGFVGEVIAFPGCIAQGETYPECLEELETVTKLWIEERIASHGKLPDPKLSLNKLLAFNQMAL